MNDRPLLLIVYGALLGWVACNWWRSEREALEQRAAWRAADIAEELLAQRRAAPPAAAAGPASSPAT
jgi:hypothetical protein